MARARSPELPDALRGARASTRLVSAHNVYVRYFTNFALLASFLGIGLGFLRANSKRDSFASLPYFLLLVIAFVMLFPVGQRSGATHGAFGMPSLPVWLSLPLIFTLVTLVMMASAAGVARVFGTFRPLHAYRLDIIGSIVGIVLFTIGSNRPTAPGRLGPRRRPALRCDDRPARNAIPLGGPRVGDRPAGRAVASISGDLWSPYYRVDVEARQRDGRTPIFVNGSPHQSIWTLGDPGEGTALLRLPVSSHPGQPAGRGAHRRGRLRQRRRPRSRPRRGACRRGRDRPGPPGVRSRAPSEPAVSGPAGPCSRGGWPSVPRAERSEI